jgi:uncharacterized membrane protein YhaH (DUF805 family)
MNWYLEVLKNYAVFRGRAPRQEYWYFVLVNLVVSVVLMLVDIALGDFDKELYIGFLSGTYGLAVIVPSFAVTVRRLHDTDRSGWWVLISCIPLIGPLIFVVFLAQDSTPGQNRYGVNPKGSG